MHLKTETYYDAGRKIWSGPKTTRKYEPKTTIGEVVFEVLKRSPQKVMQISDTTGEEKTAGQLLRDSKLIAQHLLCLGLNPGDVVGLCGKNTTNLTAVVIATLLCGTPYNPAFPGFDKENLKLVYKITTPKVFFCDVDSYETLKEAIKELELEAKIITINGKLPDVDSVTDILNNDLANLDDISFPELSGDSTAVVLCSSGTTAGPKGVTSSHSRLLEQQPFLNIDSDDIVFSFSTLFWVSGTFIILGSLLNGTTRILTEKPFTPEYFYYLVEKFKITQLLCPTEQIAALILNGSTTDTAKKLASVKLLMTGGTKVHEFITRKFLKLLDNETKLVIAYGLSEAGCMVSQTPFGTIPRINREGKLMPNLEARIVDPITGDALGPNEPGLLHIRLPYEWAGYYRNEEATKKAYANGWLDTGDIAYFDNDGFLCICAREKDIFKCNGFYIYPSKLENLILEVPGVAEACIFAKPDFSAANLPACAIVRSEDEAGKKLTETVILEHMRRNLMEIHQIKGGVHFVDKLPKTVSGKVQRDNVYHMIQNGVKC